MWTLCFASCVVWKRCDEPVSDGKGCQSLPVDRYTDMRCGFPSLALLVQGILKHRKRCLTGTSPDKRYPSKLEMMVVSSFMSAKVTSAPYG